MHCALLRLAISYDRVQAAQIVRKYWWAVVIAGLAVLIALLYVAWRFIVRRQIRKASGGSAEASGDEGHAAV